jgi:FKBP-type peptidyl-prolyl cis-trans isomerase
MVTVHYALWLYDASKPDQKGQMVQTSVGGTPFTFTLGTGAVIRGWDQGCAGMKAGGLRRLVVPSNLAYASMPPPGIPVNATLIFEVELLAVQG